MPEEQGGSRAAAWLLAEFDATDPDSGWWSVYVQPMLSLKDDEDPGALTSVDQADYADPGRWWL